MLILPAIDLRGGRCVRLRQGRYDDETVFGDDPVAVARRFEEAGATWLHMVDLDGARSGRPENLDKVAAVVKAVGMKVELGGGIRSMETVREVLDLGIARVVIGTSAIRAPEWFRELVNEHPGQVALGLDARRGLVAVDGWESQTRQSAGRIILRVRDLPLAAIIYTEIARDGMMLGPDSQQMQEKKEFLDNPMALEPDSPRMHKMMQKAQRAAIRIAQGAAGLRTERVIPFIASGGVTTVEDIHELRAIRVDGVIIGRALYEGTLTLEAALEAAGAQVEA